MTMPMDDADIDEMFEEILRLKARLERMTVIARERGDSLALAWHAVCDERDAVQAELRARELHHFETEQENAGLKAEVARLRHRWSGRASVEAAEKRRARADADKATLEKMAALADEWDGSEEGLLRQAGLAVRHTLASAGRPPDSPPTFEAMLADPNEQFDKDGVLLKSGVLWLNPDGTTTPVSDLPQTTAAGRPSAGEDGILTTPVVPIDFTPFYDADDGDPSDGEDTNGEACEPDANFMFCTTHQTASGDWPCSVGSADRAAQIARIAKLEAEVERLRDVADRLRADWLADLTNVRGIAQSQRNDAVAYRVRAEAAEVALAEVRETLAKVVAWRAKYHYVSLPGAWEELDAVLAPAGRPSDGEDEDYGPGCDCTELCAMGPTCPGGMLAGLPGSGCSRTPSDRDVSMSESSRHADGECHVEIGGQRMTESQFKAARFPLLNGVASNSEGERMREVWGRSDWDDSQDSATFRPSDGEDANGADPEACPAVLSGDFADCSCRPASQAVVAPSATDDPAIPAGWTCACSAGRPDWTADHGPHATWCPATDECDGITPCCTACASAQGPCWDCRDTGHPHPTVGLRDRHGDIWHQGADGLMHTFETAPFPLEYVQKKFGPLVAVRDV